MIIQIDPHSRLQIHMLVTMLYYAHDGGIEYDSITGLSLDIVSLNSVFPTSSFVEFVACLLRHLARSLSYEVELVLAGLHHSLALLALGAHLQGLLAVVVGVLVETLSNGVTLVSTPGES